MMSAATKFALMAAINADRELPATAKCAAYALIFTFHNSETGQCNPSLKVLAAAIGRSSRTATDAVAALLQRGWFERTLRRGTPSYRPAFERVEPSAEMGAEPRRQKAADVRQGSQDAATHRGRIIDFGTRKTATLGSQDPARGTLEKEQPPYSPPTEPSRTAAGASRTVFVAKVDPRWTGLDRRWRREKSPIGPPVHTSTEHDNASGWWFPRRWLEADEQAARPERDPPADGDSGPIGCLVTAPPITPNSRDHARRGVG